MNDFLQLKIMTKKRFVLAVEEFVLKEQMTYIEAITHICEERGMDYTSIKKWVSETLKTKIEQEAMELKLLKVKPSNKLPGL